MSTGWDWQDHALCRDGAIPLDDFYPASYAAMPPEMERACAACPVREECLEYAIWNESDGYWGGTTPLQRKTIKRNRQRQAVRDQKRGGDERDLEEAS